MSHFKPCNRYQQYLLPPSIDEWLPENHLARFIIEVIDELDLTRLTSRYSGKGSEAYHPAMMLSLLADNGYFSQDNVNSCAEHGIAPLIALGREAHHLPIAQRLQPDAPEPQTDDPLVNMAHQLKTQSGRKLYGRRKCTVEPVFGIIKQVLGFRQFLMRGLQAAAGEWKLVAMAYNFKRMHAMAAG